jgi:hypothetical protein
MLHCIPCPSLGQYFQFFWKLSARTSLHDQRTIIKSNDLSAELHDIVWLTSLVGRLFQHYLGQPSNNLIREPILRYPPKSSACSAELDYGECQWNNTTPIPSQQLVCCELTPLPMFLNICGLASIGHHAFDVAAQASNKNRCVKLAGM